MIGLIKSMGTEIRNEKNSFMNRVYDFLFYSFYCAVSKRSGGVLDRASFLVSVSTFFLTMTLLCAVILITGFDIPKNRIIILVVVLISVVNGYLTDRYYKRNNKNVLIVERFGAKYSKRKIWYALFAIFLVIGSIASFIAMGITLSKAINPW